MLLTFLHLLVLLLCKDYFRGLIHQQTIRLYEKEGLIVPKRSEGNTRLFSEEDVDKLEEIIYLTHQLGINLAGVDMILKLQKKIKRLQNEMNKVFDDALKTF